MKPTLYCQQEWSPVVGQWVPGPGAHREESHWCLEGAESGPGSQVLKVGCRPHLWGRQECVQWPSTRQRAENCAGWRRPSCRQDPVPRLPPRDPGAGRVWAHGGWERRSGRSQSSWPERTARHTVWAWGMCNLGGGVGVLSNPPTQIHTWPLCLKARSSSWEGLSPWKAWNCICWYWFVLLSLLAPGNCTQEQGLFLGLPKYAHTSLLVPLRVCRHPGSQPQAQPRGCGLPSTPRSRGPANWITDLYSSNACSAAWLIVPHNNIHT